MQVIRIKFLFLVVLMSMNTFAQEELSKPDWLNTNSFSLEELNYSTCKITGYLRKSKKSQPIKSLDLKPELMGTLLKERMCDRFQACLSGRPASRNCNDFDSERIDNKWVYTVKSSHKELDFDNEVMKFLKEYQSQLPSCEPDTKFDNCFGQGIVWNGLYVGEWANNTPNGEGIQLVTRDVPFNFNKNVWNSIYKGSFKDGMFHGQGKFFNLEESFDGEWFMGEMHGQIQWQWPVIYKFGFNFERSEKGLKVTQVDLFSPADVAGLKVSSIIQSIETSNKKIIASETGLASIKRLLQELDRDELITLEIIDTFNDVSNQVYSMCNEKKEDIYACNNIIIQACKYLKQEEAVNSSSECYDTLTKNIIATLTTEDQNYELTNPTYTLSFSKSQANLKDQSTFFCMDSLNEKCYEKSKLKNTLIKNGKTSRGSFFMGTRHAYTNDDLYVYIENDGSMRWDLMCHNTGRPFLVLTKDKKILEKIKFVTPSAFIYENEYISPCAERLGSKPEIFYFPHVLKDTPKDIDLIAESTGLFKIDILDYIDEFIIKLDQGYLPYKIQSTVHGWCKIAVIRSKYCNSKNENRLASHILRKTLDNPNTLGYQRKKDLQLLRAEENYLTLAHCKAEYPYPDSSYSRFKTCVAKFINWDNTFWFCVYSGNDMSRCKRTNNIGVREKFKLDNPDLLKDVDLSEWVFGEL